MFFILFLFITGGLIVALGGVASLIASLIGTNQIVTLYFQTILTSLFTIGYVFILEKWYKGIYNSMKMSYKTLTTIQKIKSRSVIFILLTIHLYGLKWLYTESSSFLHFAVIGIPLSILLGLVLKTCIDEAYEIKLSKEGHDMIYGDMN